MDAKQRTDGMVAPKTVTQAGGLAPVAGDLANVLTTQLENGRLKASD